MSQGKSFAAIYAEMNAKKLDENVEEVKASETVEEVAEDQEQLDELSKKTLGSYINKANRDSDMSSFRSGKLYGKELATKRKTAADREQSKKENHNSQKREKGISMAVKKLTREETEVEDNQEHIEETAAADTIKTHPTSFSSKASMMANVMGAMSAMTSDECVKWFDAAMNIANSKLLPSKHQTTLP
jgi:capsid portal protein